MVVAPKDIFMFVSYQAMAEQISSSIKSMKEGKVHTLYISGPAGIGKLHAVTMFLRGNDMPYTLIHNSMYMDVPDIQQFRDRFEMALRLRMVVVTDNAKSLSAKFTEDYETEIEKFSIAGGRIIVVQTEEQPK